MQANRNGFFYVLDRTNGKMILAKPFVTQNWAKEISPEGRPILVPGTNPSEEGSVKVCPDLGGGTNFFSPSYDPTNRLFFVNARETCAVYFSWHEPFREGERSSRAALCGRAISATSEHCAPSIPSRAIGSGSSDIQSRPRRDCRRQRGWSSRATATETSSRTALNSKSGKYLWHYQLGVGLRSTGGTTYIVDGKQYLLFSVRQRADGVRAAVASTLESGIWNLKSKI